MLVCKLRCKETGQYRKGELGLKSRNLKVLYANLGFQKSQVCPILAEIKSGKSQNFYINMP